jgi:hypothetical protein
MRRLAALTAAIAVAALWLALYRSPMYSPALGLLLAIAGAFFFCALVLLYRIHAHEWPGIARLGFAISAIGVGLWIAGGTMNGLGVQGTESRSAMGRFMLEVLRGPQAGWGLLCVGLIPIGVAAFITRLSLPMRLLLPVGSLFVLGPPLKYLLGEQAGGMAVLVAFGVGWLAIGALLLAETINRT